MKVKSLMAILVLALCSMTIQARSWTPYYGNSVSGSGKAHSQAKTSGSTKNRGTGHKEATSGAWNNSSAGATAKFSDTRGVRRVSTKGKDITGVVTKFNGSESNTAWDSTHFHSYGTESGTTTDSVDNSSYRGINLFGSVTNFSDNSVTSYSAKAVGVDTNASTVGGSFGTTLGYGSKTDSSYHGHGDSWGSFRLNNYGRTNR